MRKSGPTPLAPYVVAGIALYLLASAATASVIHFDVAGAHGSFVNITNQDILGPAHIAASLDPHLDSQVFDLAAGQSKTFDFFEVTVGGFGGGTADIEVGLAFDAPSSASVAGFGDGWFFTFFGAFSAGVLEWASQPDPLVTASGHVFDVSFSDIAAFGPGSTAVVTATVEATHVAAVPEPGTLGLVGIGLAGVAWMRRRKRLSA